MDLTQLRHDYRAQRLHLMQTLPSRFMQARGVFTVLRQFSDLADAVLQKLFAAHLPAQCALLAVGGLGRQELFPYSDVDVLILFNDEGGIDKYKSKIEQFVSQCWDMGLELGSSVRTVAQCLAVARQDLSAQTAMLEARPVAGSAALYAQFQQAFSADLQAKDFFNAKTLELRQRHLQFEDTPYALEPNCKESPGGLRDLQLILWVARGAGMAKDWGALAAEGVATVFEIAQIKRNYAALSLIRAHLHVAAQRREDRLVFDLQGAVAARLGLSRAGHVKEGSEALMRRYYWAAKAVTQLNQILMLNIQERLFPSAHESRPINSYFNEKANMLEVADEALYLQQPHAILETFWVYQTTPGMKGLSARTLRALYNARQVMGASFRQDPVNRETFMRILRNPEGVTHALRLMNQTSVLGRYLWVFRKIVGQMQHDLFHVYTVDQHILMVVRNLRRFFIAEHAHEYPLCSELAAGWSQPWVLYVAALFHDIAKGRGGDHSILGEQEVARFCAHHQIKAQDAQLIAFLVRHHLLMSQVAQKQDFSDLQILSNFAQIVGNERYLTALYLLTVADIRGTSPKVWNAWRGKLLEDLYQATLRLLGGAAPQPQAQVLARQHDAQVLLALYAQPSHAHERLWETLHVSYFMRHDAIDIAWHARQLGRLLNQNPVPTTVRARLSRLGEGIQVMVYTPDAQDLFARICGYFDKTGFSILDAKVHTTQNGYALDTFQVISPDLPQYYRELLSRIETELTQTLNQAGPLPPPRVGRISRRARHFPITPRVELRPDETGQSWLLDLSANDRPGLLYGVARVLAHYKINLQLAKITTLGERVEDTLLIEGVLLQDQKTQIEIEQALLAVLRV